MEVVATDAQPASGKSSPGHVTDSRGRKLVVRLIDPLEEYRLARIMGAAADSNRATSLAMAAASVRVIDGEPQPFPNSDRELQTRLQLLGADGISAVNQAWVDISEAAPKPPGIEAVKN